MRFQFLLALFVDWTRSCFHAQKKVVMDELDLMLYSEAAITDMYNILSGKKGLDLCPILQKCMDIEEFIYENARKNAGLDLRQIDFWKDMEAMKLYKDHLDKVKKAMKDREEDWDKLLRQDARKVVNTLSQEGKRKVEN